MKNSHRLVNYGCTITTAIDTVELSQDLVGDWIGVLFNTDLDQISKAKGFQISLWYNR